MNDAPKDSENEAAAQRLSQDAGLNFEQGRRVMMALAHGQDANGGKGFSEGELAKAMGAVQNLFVGGVVAKMVFDGEMLIQVDDEGTVRYLTSPSFDPDRKV